MRFVTPPPFLLNLFISQLVTHTTQKIKDLKDWIIVFGGFLRDFWAPMFAISRCQRRRLRCPSREADTIHVECRTNGGGVSVTAVRADGDENLVLGSLLEPRGRSLGIPPLARRPS